MKHLFLVVLAMSATLAPQPSWARRIEVHTFNGPSRRPVAVAGVTLNVADTTIGVGKTFTITENLQPAKSTNKNVSWTSSNTAVATVTEGGLVTALDTGVATITVTTADGGKTAACKARVCFLAINGVCWADANVDDYQTFAARPDMYTKYYQWNRGKAWAAPTGGSVVGWNPTHDPSATWTNTPCPKGWQLPTREELEALVAVSGASFGSNNRGGTWAEAGSARGNLVAGRFYGSAHATCSLPSSMSGCVFLPASSSLASGDGTLLFPQGSWGLFWSSTELIADRSYYLAFDDGTIENYSVNGNGMKEYAYTVRCVRDVP